MSIRIRAARSLIRLGKFIQSLAVMVMKPRDLIEFGSQSYSHPGSVEGWSRSDFVAEGLIPCEKQILVDIPLKKGRVLVLGMGGGREAIALAKMGFTVTGIDFIPGMVQRAQINAREQGVEIQGLVQEISRIGVPDSSFDLAWLCSTMYSCVPTRKRRLEMLGNIHRSLRPDGYLVCQFHWEPHRTFSFRSTLIKRFFSYLTLGYFAYEEGDILWQNGEFLHVFTSEEKLKSELTAGGFETVRFYFPQDSVRGQAILRRV
jgi:SAM-dependent methyltransferase